MLVIKYTARLIGYTISTYLTAVIVYLVLMSTFRYLYPETEWRDVVHITFVVGLIISFNIHTIVWQRANRKRAESRLVTRAN